MISYIVFPYPLNFDVAGGPLKSISSLISLLHAHTSVHLLYPRSALSNSTLIAANVIKSSVRAWFFPITIFKLVYHSRKETTHFYFNSFFSFSFTIVPLFLLLLLSRFFSIRLTVAPRGELQQLHSKSLKKLFYIKVFLLFTAFTKPTFHITSDKEFQAYTELFPRYPHFFCPNLTSNKPLFHSPKSFDDKPLKFLVAGRISPEKQQVFALKVWQKLFSLDPFLNFHLYVVGALGRTHTYNQQLLREIKSTPFATYIGPLPYDELQLFMSKCHFLITPTDGENFGHAIYESIVNKVYIFARDTTIFDFANYPAFGINISGLSVDKWAQTILDITNQYRPSLHDSDSSRFNLLSTIVDNRAAESSYIKYFAGLSTM